jgi:acyl-coenzyme A synthetase/AMP-(fatty) acid ligase
MGRPVPGWDVEVVTEDGERAPDDTVGNIAIRYGERRPVGLFDGYAGDEEANAKAFRDGWYYTGDKAKIDDDGYFWFEGRSDDIIKSAGYRIGPFEIESALLKHGAVVEAAGIGAPHQLRGQIIKAFVVTRPGVERSENLADELVELVKAVCGQHQFPRAIEFVDCLPKTQTGKIQRFLLRQRALRDKVSP